MRLAIIAALAAACSSPASGAATPDASAPPADNDAAGSGSGSAAVFAYPPGCYSVAAATDGPVPAAMLANPGLVGVEVSIQWDELEGSGDDQFDWADMDARVAEAVQGGKRVMIGIVASAAHAPAWLAAMPGVTTVEIADPNPNHGNGTITVVPWWDPTFRAQKLAMLRAAGAHFAGNPNIAGVMTAFANYYTNDWAMPPAMLGSGYSYDTMIAIGEEVLATTAAAFPDQAIKLPIGKNDATTDPDKEPTQMAMDIVAYALASPFASRFFAQKNLIDARTPDATDPAITSADPTTNDYLLNALHGITPHDGLQMLASATGGSNDGCRQNGGVSPCPPADVLQASIDAALTFAPTYLEFWTADATNPALYPLFQSATQAMQAR